MYPEGLLASRLMRLISAWLSSTARTSSLWITFRTLSCQHVARWCRFSAADASGSVTMRFCSEHVKVARSSSEGRRDRTHTGQKYNCCMSADVSASTVGFGAAGSTYLTHSANPHTFTSNYALASWEVEGIRQRGRPKKTWWDCQEWNGKFRPVSKWCAVQE